MDLQILRMFLAFPLVFLVVNGATIVIGFAILFTQSWLLGLVLLGPAVPLVALCSYFETHYALVARRAQDQAGDLATLVEESVLGIRIVKAFGRHRSQARAFRGKSRDLWHTEMRKARLLSDIWAVIMTLPELAIGAALLIGVLQVSDDKLSAGTLVAFLSTALALRWPVESIGFLLAMSNEAATASDRYFEAMDAGETDALGASGPAVSSGAAGSAGSAGPADPDIRLDADGVRLAGEGVRLDADGVRLAGEGVRLDADGVRLEGVRFRYPDAAADSPELLTGVDLHIRPGETMALVGATGSGKTTLTALLPRLHEATAGRITLDGADIAELPAARLRELVAVAFEDPTLFSASVRENVAMGAGPDGAGEEQVLRALAIAQCDFVQGLPQGLDTQVGEQGLSLSGGQRQRLALARAVVGKPRFLVLDDPLSALDVHTEALVEGALREVLRETTALVVAHRPSTVLLADRVALLTEGRITAVGTHAELLRDSAEYRHLMSGADRDSPGTDVPAAAQSLEPQGLEPEGFEPEGFGPQVLGPQSPGPQSRRPGPDTGRGPVSGGASADGPPSSDGAPPTDDPASADESTLRRSPAAGHEPLQRSDAR
jgi:ATP-binding cassette subfamily B protein